MCMHACVCACVHMCLMYNMGMMTVWCMIFFVAVCFLRTLVSIVVREGLIRCSSMYQ